MKSSSDDTYKAAKKEKNDLKTILKEEIHKSFLIISENLTQVHDEEKLRTIFKQVKWIQKNVQGEPEITAKWEKKTDINSMVKRDSIIEFFWKTIFIYGMLSDLFLFSFSCFLLTDKLHVFNGSSL